MRKTNEHVVEKLKNVESQFCTYKALTSTPQAPKIKNHLKLLHP